MEAAILYTDCTVSQDLKWHPRRWDEPRRPIYSDIQIFRYSDIQIFRKRKRKWRSGFLLAKEKEVEGGYIGYAPPSGICDLTPKSR